MSNETPVAFDDSAPSDLAPGERPATERPTLVYLAGAPHSGSTILETLLAAAPGVYGIGQFGRFYAHREAHSKAMSCSCGKPPASCEPCVAVRTDIRSSLGERRYRWTGRLTRREWGLPLLFAIRPLRRHYAAASDAALDSLVRNPDCAVVVDSSKSISRGLSILDTKAFDVRVVFCVRNPNGFVSSRIKRLGTDDPIRNTFRTWKWLLKNVMVERILLPRATSFTRVRFEDLTAEPVETMRSLCAELGIDSSRVVKALDEGLEVERAHLFEPRRDLDYRVVTFDRERGAQTAARGTGSSRLIWLVGGWYGKRYGYESSTTH